MTVEHAPDTLLEVTELRKFFPITQGLLKRTVGHVRAVDDVSFSIPKGKTLGLVGESGCGKTTTSRLILRAFDPSSGAVWFKDRQKGWVDVTKLDSNSLRGLRPNMQMIFQDPYSSLNPRMTLVEVIGEPLLVNGIARGSELHDRVAYLLRRVGLRPEYVGRYPHGFSGGQRQRIGIARALAPNPQLVVCDEPVSALDVSIQAQILNLLQDLQQEFGLTYLFVAHDLSVVEHISDRVAVMYVGKLVEMADTEELFEQPLHPYTEALLAAVPTPDPHRRRRSVGQARPLALRGEVADPSNPPSGCYFHPRCPYAVERCTVEAPALRELRPNHVVSCHRAEELTLRGVPPPQGGSHV
ncbi:MAG TPA: oligopeptide/dipeptide ABC transporter ATP-binding protein [Chloroflexota bacterium]